MVSFEGLAEGVMGLMHSLRGLLVPFRFITNGPSLGAIDSAKSAEFSQEFYFELLGGGKVFFTVEDVQITHGFCRMIIGRVTSTTEPDSDLRRPPVLSRIIAFYVFQSRTGQLYSFGAE